VGFGVLPVVCALFVGGGWSGGFGDGGSQTVLGCTVFGGWWCCWFSGVENRRLGTGVVMLVCRLRGRSGGIDVGAEVVVG